MRVTVRPFHGEALFEISQIGENISAKFNDTDHFRETFRNVHRVSQS